MATHRQSGIATAKDWPQRGPPALKDRNMPDALCHLAGVDAMRPRVKHIVPAQAEVRKKEPLQDSADAILSKEHRGQLPSTRMGPGVHPAATRGFALVLVIPTDGNGLPRRTDKAQGVHIAPPSEENILRRAPPAKMAGTTSSCNMMLRAPCVLPALRSPFLGCKGEAGMIAGRRPP